MLVVPALIIQLPNTLHISIFKAAYCANYFWCGLHEYRKPVQRSRTWYTSCKWKLFGTSSVSLTMTALIMLLRQGVCFFILPEIKWKWYIGKKDRESRVFSLFSLGTRHSYFLHPNNTANASPGYSSATLLHFYLMSFLFWLLLIFIILNWPLAFSWEKPFAAEATRLHEGLCLCKPTGTGRNRFLAGISSCNRQVNTFNLNAVALEACGGKGTILTIYSTFGWQLRTSTGQKIFVF